MHDLKALRAVPSAFDAALNRRGLEPVTPQVLALDAQRREMLTELQELQHRRKTFAKDMMTRHDQGIARLHPLITQVLGKDEDVIPREKKRVEQVIRMREEAVRQREQISLLEAQIKEREGEIEAILSRLPNILADEVPDGVDEDANQELFRSSEPKEPGFKPKEHYALGEDLGQMDFQTAAKISGSRFVVLRGALARLERALGQYMLDMQIRNGYEETAVPALVSERAMYWTDKLPKFAEESYQTTDGRWLIPTAEVPLAASVAEQILAVDELPRRMAALTPCFRSEAGSAGRDVRGMLRQHQFVKCELVCVCAPEESDKEHERMLEAAESVLKELDIPFRRMLLCAGDTGFGAAKTYDLEAWMPGQRAWREVASISNARDFQARRMNARCRSSDGLKFVHTLNGSGVAVGRAMIALMENYQTGDGDIEIPKALRPYMGGETIISKRR